MIRCASLFCLLALGCGSALAQSASSQAECEKKYPNAMEFNRCLASLAPVSGRMRRVAPQGRNGGEPGRVSTVRRGGRVSSTLFLGSAPVTQGRGGRKSVSFDLRRR